MHSDTDAARPAIDGERTHAVAVPARQPHVPFALPSATDRALPARPSALATSLAHSLATLETRHAQLLKCVADVAGELAVALHGAALGNAVLQRLELPPEARAVALQQRRGLDLALAALAVLRLAPGDATGDSPADADRAGGAAQEAERALLPDELHVLVIDDDASVRLATRLLLEMSGLDVRVAAGREDALESVANETPDVVVADCSLVPGAACDALLGDIERLCGGAVPAVVVCRDDRVAAPPERRVVLQKPFGIATLLAALRRATDASLSAATRAPAPAPVSSAR